MMYGLFGLFLSVITVYTWGFVDVHAPYVHIPGLWQWVQDMRGPSTVIYAGIVAGLFVWYGYFFYRAVTNRISVRELVSVIILVVGILLVSYPAFSNDIFNYIATARVTYTYRENPYVVMPIDIPNEPMLSYLHAANKTALYGPTWIILTAIPHSLGMGSPLVTLFAFKAFVAGWYLLLTWMIWRLTGRIWGVVLFALNPLVIINILIDAHNDVVMMVLALGAFVFLKRKQHIAAGVLLAGSILVKGATVFLIPVFGYVLWKNTASKRVSWQSVWTWSAYSMFAVFMLSPFREEMYGWYFVWPLTFVALRSSRDILTWVSVGFSIGLPLRFLPFVYTHDWGGVVPKIKKIVTVIPPAVSAIIYATRTRH